MRAHRSRTRDVIALAFAAILTAVPIPGSAGFFGPTDVRECVVEFNQGLRYRPALSMLLNACQIGYMENPPDHIKKMKTSAKCVVSRASEIFSAESARSILNLCTRNDLPTYQFISGTLESSIQAAEPKRPPDIRDCILVGPILDCR
jgi:hypothetical protein